MKQLLTTCIVLLTFLSFGQGPQTWPEAFHQEDVDIIKTEIAALMESGEIDKVLARTTFPFKGGEKKYTKAELKAAFNDLFTPGMCKELASSTTYEVINPEGDTYMNVCRNSPEGYEGAVLVFELKGGVWMLSSMDLYMD